MATTHPMLREWRELTDLTRGVPLVVERVRIADSGIAIEGKFVLPRLAQLTMEDQIFVAAFVRAHGSIKEMEQVFGVSYPTIKTRLNRLAAVLDLIETTTAPAAIAPLDDIVERLERGELTPDEAILALETQNQEAI